MAEVGLVGEAGLWQVTKICSGNWALTLYSEGGAEGRCDGRSARHARPPRAGGLCAVAGHQGRLPGTGGGMMRELAELADRQVSVLGAEHDGYATTFTASASREKP